MPKENLITVEGKTVNIPHLGVTLRAIAKVATAAYAGGSRYYDIRCEGVHVGRIALKMKTERA